MKKILSLALASAMVMSALPVAYAAENEADYSAGTKITLNGSGTEEWTVTVPASMTPGQTGTVKAEGTWAADKFLAVDSAYAVTLTYGAQSMDVAISLADSAGEIGTIGRGFTLIGNSVDPVSREVTIEVANASRLFGTWEGIIEYNVVLIDKGDVNRDGIITEEDIELIRADVTGSAVLTDEQKIYADVDGDGEITGRDGNVLQSIIDGGNRIMSSFWDCPIMQMQ